MPDYLQSIEEYINLEISILRKIDKNAVNSLMNILDNARLRGSTVFIMGNGGSAGTASHFANDFNKGLSEYLDKPFRFLCLNDNIATIMAIANDIGYDAVFEFQLKNKVAEGDVVIGISGSGNSQNVLNAIRYAKSVGALTVGLTGFEGGKLASLADVSVNVPVMSMQITEDIHLIFDHLIMSVFYRTLCGIEHLSEHGS